MEMEGTHAAQLQKVQENVQVDIVSLYIDAYRKYNEAKKTMDAIRAQALQMRHDQGVDSITNGTDTLEMTVSQVREMAPNDLMFLLKAHKLESKYADCIKEPTVNIPAVEKLVKAKLIPADAFNAFIKKGQERVTIKPVIGKPQRPGKAATSIEGGEQ